jgi:pimeloyl-ACP methyl ester carboxylesterase
MRLRKLALSPLLGLANFAGGVLGQPLEGLLDYPEQSFERSVPPLAPDYTEPAAWAAWPGKDSYAEAVPPGIAPRPQSGRPADAFFVHPTTYLSGQSWNARFDQPGSAWTITDLTMRNQASVFNGACRIFAPRYRQASAIAFTEGPETRAFDLAYADVRRAFDHYLAHQNGGRPFILAGHSQGSIHVLRLLQERLIGTAELSRLVAAYAIGAAAPSALERLGLPIGRAPAQTGCILSWNCLGAWSCQFAPWMVWSDGRYQTCPERDRICTNPLAWTEGGASPASANRGALPGVDIDEPLRALVPSLTGARCRNGTLVVRLAQKWQAGFRDAATWVGNYHIYDYNLFYMNIRENVERRVGAFASNALRQPQSGCASAEETGRTSES